MGVDPAGGVIVPERVRPPTPRPATLLAVLAIAIGLVIWVVVFGSGATEEAIQGGGFPDREAREIQGLVGDFANAVTAGDGREALSLFDPDWTSLELPGLPLGFVNPARSEDENAAALRFFGDVMDLRLGPCRVESPRLDTRRRRAVCNDVVVTGAYADAVRSGDLPTTVILAVDDGKITSVLRAPVGLPAMLEFCAWAEQSHPELAVAAFDNRCWPVAGSEDAGTVHAALAAEYLALGRPGADDRYASLRWNAGVVDRFVELHNLGGGTPRYFAPGKVVTLPGIVGRPDAEALDQADILAWSSRAYRIDLGACEVSESPDVNGVSVSCPQARWGGPLVEALQLDPVAQPVGFLVAAGSIVGVEGATAPELEDAIRRFCRTVQINDSAVASRLFSPECTPVYRADSADATVELAARQAAL